MNELKKKRRRYFVLKNDNNVSGMASVFIIPIGIFKKKTPV